MVAGIDFDLELNNMTPMLVVGVGAILANSKSAQGNRCSKTSSSAFSPATLGAVLIGHQAILHLTDLGAFTALQFLVVAFGVFFFDSRGRHEIATILTFAMMGINVGIVAVGHYNDILDPNYKIGDALVPQALDFQRQALGYVFFSYLTIFIGLGLLLSVALRGIINPESSEGWFGKISPVMGYNVATLPSN